MESKEIKNILEQFDTTNTYKKIFINGAWGIGKSYYTNEYIKENSENIVYISLFGKISYETIENAITNELTNKMNKIEKFKKKVKKIAKGINSTISLCGISISTSNYVRKTFIEEFSNLLEEKELIIIIDDLERKSGNILIEDIMGMIEELSMFKKIKIAIIGDETNIASEDLEKWKKFKEKIIEKEYIIQKFSDESIYNLVNKEIINYINKSEIDEFVNNFIIRHKIQNLRTIIKGINLFKEIVNNYIENKNNKKVNLMLLKNSMSIAIECTEKIYKPKKEVNKKNPYLYAIDENISSRISNHYFNSMTANNNDSCVLNYILKIFNCNFNQETINMLNDTIKDYLKIKKETKDIFYLSEEKISNKICRIYKNMSKGTYKFSTLDEFIDDSYKIVTWNEILNLNINFQEFKFIFNKILFDNFYSPDKNIYQNKIDRFDLKRKESKYLSDLIDNYNKTVEIKNIDDKFLYIEKSYNEKKYDKNSLEWLDMSLLQNNKQIVMDKFINKCRNNNFFIPDLSGEINGAIWEWTHKIWKLFYERMNKQYKCELNDYVESIKNNKLSSYRIGALQKYRPLIQNKD